MCSKTVFIARTKKTLPKPDQGERERGREGKREVEGKRGGGGLHVMDREEDGEEMKEIR